MELQKRSLHMEGPRLHASKQVVLEDNVIIPDTNKDADKLLLDRGKITIEEVNSFEDAVTVKGKTAFPGIVSDRREPGRNSGFSDGGQHSI